MNYLWETVLWASGAIAIIFASLVIPEVVIRRRRAKEQRRADKVRRRLKQRQSKVGVEP